MRNIRDDIDYYDHQIIGIRKMARMQSFILGDDMGLGKSLQSLTVFAVAQVQGETNRVLIVSPSSLKPNWEEEISQYGVGIECQVLSNASPIKREKELDAFAMSTKNVLVVNYEQVNRHWPRLNKMGFGIVIADEAHALKDRNAIRTKAFYQLNMPRKFLLTGSPMLNDVTELWSLLHIVAPHRFQNYWSFCNRYAVWGGYKDKECIGIKNEKELREILHFYMIRREKSDCLDLPEKQIIPCPVDMHPEQKKIYATIKDDLKIEPQDPNSGDDVIEVANGGVKFNFLRMLCGTTASFKGHDDFSSKLDFAVEKCDEIINRLKEPVVVFTQYRAIIRCMQARLDKLGIPHECLHGDVPSQDRIPRVNQWTADFKAGQPKVLLCMYQVAGTGMNMTAAQKLIAIDKLVVPKLQDQAYDRLHRIGQKGTVQIFEIIMRKSVEQRIEKLINRKTGLFGAIVSTSEGRRRLIQAALEEDEFDAP